ncbi:MAG: hypothetical protein ABJE66_27915 [Deltaproteobacteria bacterium]
MRLTYVSLILSAALGGCLGTGTADVQYSSDVSVSTPDLVEVSPGVQVVADYDDSVFYSDGFYWRYDNGGWYRSNNYAGGFVYWNAPPQAVITINDPGRYRHYRPSGYQPRHQQYRRPEPIVRDHREPERREEPMRTEPMNQPEVRDHREPERHEAPAPMPAPVVRDHRDNDAPAPHASPGQKEHEHEHEHEHGHDHDHDHDHDHGHDHR